LKRGKVTNRILDRYLGIPVLNILACLKRKRVAPQNPSRIGILLNPALGDTMLASAPIQDIRAAYPAAKLILFAARSNMLAAALLPDLDAIEPLPITSPLSAIRVLRRSKLDLMLDFTSWQRLTALYTLMSGAKFRIGFKREGQHRHRGYDAVVPHLGSCHELENMRRLASFSGTQADSIPRLIVPEDPIPEFAVQPVDLVVFHAWATGTFCFLREWPEENWVELASRLRSPNRIFVLTGGPADELRCHALRGRMASEGVRAEILIGRNGLGEVARVLQRAEMLVTVNTGTMHLGAILGTPTVALNGPNSEHRWGPIGARVANVPTSDGSGGFLDLGFEFNGRNVMDKISVDAVMASIHTLHLKSLGREHSSAASSAAFAEEAVPVS
jgi:heptosyltransferase III